MEYMVMLLFITTFDLITDRINSAQIRPNRNVADEITVTFLMHRCQFRLNN